MNYYFEDPEHVTLLRIAASSWRGTPFRFGSKAKGVGGGTDCVGLLESLLAESGAVPAFNIPRRPRDLSVHVRNDRVLNYLRGKADDPQSTIMATRFAELPRDTSPLLPGDVIVLKKENADLFHLPIVIDPPRCIHCSSPAVAECDATDPYISGKIEAIFRVKA